MFSAILQTIILSVVFRHALAAPVHANMTSIDARDAGSAPPKLVVAHMMVGNTYSYSVDTWASDIELAAANGIDGFALNIGSAASFTDSQVANACVSDFMRLTLQSDALDVPSSNSFQAAAQFPDFKLFYSFDMTVTACVSDADGAYLRNKVSQYSSSPNMLRVNDKVFVSTFAGDAWSAHEYATCAAHADGCVASAWGVDGWKAQFTAHPDMTGSNGVFFVPSFFTDPAKFGQYSGLIDGMFNVRLCCVQSLKESTANKLSLVQWRMGDRTEQPVCFGPDFAGWWARVGQGLHLGPGCDRCFALLHDCRIALVLHGTSACLSLSFGRLT
jgi:hypothetical protein